jgi:DNA-binding MarR family transcriptional regulator
MQTGRLMSDIKNFDLEQFLPYRLSVLANTVSQGIAASYRDEHGISVTEWRILAVLGRYPGLTASEVSDRTAMDKVAIHRGVKSLLEKDLLMRETDPADRRRQCLLITPGRGRTVLNKVIPRAERFERQLLEALSPEESRSFFQSLEKLQKAAVKLNERH